MNRQFLSIVTAALLFLNATGLSMAAGPRKKPAAKAQTNTLVAKLPASDAVAVIDARRVFDTALPRVFASSPNLLAKISSGISDFQLHTGIDVRRFDQIVVGANVVKKGPKDFDLDLVALAKGSMNMGSLIAGAKLASNAGYREEKVGERTVYIFSVKEITAKQMAQTGVTSGTVDNTIQKVPDEMAVTTYDTNTLAIGSPARVRELLAGGTTVAPELTALLGRHAGAVMTFAAQTPDGLDAYVPMDNDELGKNLDAIRYVAGWVDVVAAGSSLNVMARTTGADKAQGLFDTIDFLQKFGKGVMGASKKPENAVYARMLNNAKLAKVGADVTLDLTVPQSDIDILLATMVKK
jgi:hypothetical protein